MASETKPPSKEPSASDKVDPSYMLGVNIDITEKKQIESESLEAALAKRHLKVLYLDDEPQLCAIFVDLFNSDLVEVKAFTNPAEAIAAAKLDPPDVAFLDYRMPGTTGAEVANAMRPDIPKYLITADISGLNGSAFIGIFDKPFDVELIQDVLDRRLKAIKAA